MHSKQQQNLIL